MIEELAYDYSQYVKVNLQTELKDVQETIDDMLTRLDEFENLVNMVKIDSELCADISIPIVMHSKIKLDSLCDQIDALEKVINHAKSDLEIMEMKVDEAEAELGQLNIGKIRSILKPFLLKISSNETSMKRPVQTPTTYQTQNLFTTSSFFPSQAEDAVQEEKKLSS